MTSQPNLWDVLIIGGGPAGLSAALTLGRCRRTTLLCDAGTPRSWAAVESHGYLTRDCIDPKEIRRLGREELRRYPSVVCSDSRVLEIERAGALFRATLETGESVTCRKVLLATGLFDELPSVPGIEVFFGKSVHQCPYCDGWEHRDEPLAVYARGKGALNMVRGLTAWSEDLVLFTDGDSTLPKAHRRALSRYGIPIEETPIAALNGSDGYLESITLKDGRKISRRAMFFDMPCHQQSPLAAKLGCIFSDKGGVAIGKYEATNVPGVYAAGNAVKDVHLVVAAAAEGAKAAMGINKSLTRENFDLKLFGKAAVVHPSMNLEAMTAPPLEERKDVPDLIGISPEK